MAAHINTYAEVKALADYVCTSANCLKIVESLPDVPILFIPDKYLGMYIAAKTGKRIETWDGQYHLHAKLTSERIFNLAKIFRDAEFLIHPEFHVVKALPEGTRLRPGDEVICFRGPARDIPKVESTLLNLLMHASGVATYTRKLVDLAKSANPRVRVAATHGEVRHVMHKYGAEEKGGEAEQLYWQMPRQLNSAVAVKLAGARRVDMEVKGDAPEGLIVHEIHVKHDASQAYIRVENAARGTTSVVTARSTPH